MVVVDVKVRKNQQLRENQQSHMSNFVGLQTDVCKKKNQTRNTTPRLSPCQQMKQACHVAHKMAQATFGLQVYFVMFVLPFLV